MGPGWYWRENVSLILEWGRCRAGNVQPSDCKYAFTASDHAPCDALKEVFDKIEEIVVAACARSHLWASEPREYSEDTCRREVKLFILSMIGSWTTQHSYNWRCEVAALEDDVVGRVERWRDNGDGTTKFMSRAETVSNRTMFLIGRIPLDVEHAEMFKLRRVLRRLPVQIHGGVNDCMYVKRCRGKECDIENAVVTNIELRPGSFRVSGPDHQAPANEWLWPAVVPKPSSYKPYAGPNPRTTGSFGAWLSNMEALAFEWRERIRRGDADFFPVSYTHLTLPTIYSV